jgi:hypothetical protein
MTSLLTDDEMRALGKDAFGIDLTLDGSLMKYGRDIEAAILAKIGEPVAWRVVTKGGSEFYHVGVSSLEDCYTAEWLASCRTITPVYALPRSTE